MDDPALSLPGRKKVVVVEDDDEMRDLESFLLGAEGYQVAAVAEGRAALPAVKREGADLVLLDLVLPDESGNDVLAELERDPATADVPVIVVTAYSKHFRHVQATRQVRRIISKPFDPMDLLNAVDEELRRGPVV
jgi:DNA-binding response OmpR family regulator